MVDTTKVSMSKNWVKISDGDCTVQANSNEQFQFAISATMPTTNAGLFLRIGEPVTLAYKTAVWCRLPDNYVRSDTIAISIVK